MSLNSVIKDVCAAVGVLIPQGSVFPQTPTDRTSAEMISLANEMAQRIAYDVRDWKRFTVWGKINCDGVTYNFNLPSDFKRMLKTANIYSSSRPYIPMRFIPDTDDWIRRRLRNVFGYPVGEWTMMNNQICTWPLQVNGVVLNYGYMHENCVALNAGGFGNAFVNDGDSFALDERLLKLGMIWQWKANKGGSYAEDLETYNDALGFIAGADTPSPVIIGHVAASSQAINVAYPWDVPTTGPGSF